VSIGYPSVGPVPAVAPSAPDPRPSPSAPPASARPGVTNRPPGAFPRAGRSPLRSNPMTFWSIPTVPILQHTSRHAVSAKGGSLMRSLQYADLARFTAQGAQPRHVALRPTEAGSPPPDRRAAVRGFRCRTDVSGAAPRASQRSTMFRSRLRPVIDVPRRARNASPSGGRDARRAAAWLRGAVARATASGRLVRRSGLLLCDRVVAVPISLSASSDPTRRP
jgi:hypothetical protein